MSAYKQFKITLFFIGNLPDRSFFVYGKDGPNAVEIAKYDARAMGYNIACLTGHEVEEL